MAITAKPEILRPGSERDSHAFSDRNLDLLSHLLDDFIRVPGTSIRFGLDGIVGLVPGIGDLLGGLASCLLILAACVRGVPRATVARMMLNVAIETAVGSLPVVGDMFDIWFRANRRNYALMTRALEASPLAEKGRRAWTDWLVLSAALLALLGLILLPVILVGWVATHLLSLLKTRLG